MNPATIVTVTFIITSVLIVWTVLKQEAKTPGLGALTGYAGVRDSYWGKHKGRSAQGRIVLATRILILLFLGQAVYLTYFAK